MPYILALSLVFPRSRFDRKISLRNQFTSGSIVGRDLQASERRDEQDSSACNIGSEGLEVSRGRGACSDERMASARRGYAEQCQAAITISQKEQQQQGYAIISLTAIMICILCI